MSSENATRGTVRPGGRTARVRAAVLRAAADALAEEGFAHLDLADIGRRAGVGKTTVYRRWGTVTGVVSDLLGEMAKQSVRRTETGSLVGDLTAIARLVRRTLVHPRKGAVLKAVIAAATCDPQTADALHRFYHARVDRWAPCVQQAIVRGEVPRDTATHEVVRAVAAPLYYRLLASGHPLDEAAARRAAEAAATAARAGAFVSAD